MHDFEYLLSSLDTIEGIGKKTLNLFNKKNINTIFDLLWHLPTAKIEISKESDINNLQIGKMQRLNVIPLKYNFPRLRNLPNKVICIKNSVKIDCIFFNSYEGYIKKILPIDKECSIAGKVGFYKNRYQLINPVLITDKEENLIKDQNKYSLTEGLTSKKYNEIINKVLIKLPNLNEWHSNEVLKQFNNVKWRESVIRVHKDSYDQIKKSNYLKRLIFDEIFAHYLLSSQIRTKIKKNNKIKKVFNNESTINTLNKLNFELTNDQKKAVEAINRDLTSNKKMFRLLQGDVGSGKTIVSIIAALNTINSGYQVSMMVPTEILAKQHFNFMIKNFKNNYKVELLTGKTEHSKKKIIINNLKKKKIDFIIGTHALFQNKIEYSKLGLIIIDEQHKFGVKQRKKLSDKGGNNCDVLVMSATPIPRTMMMTVYGDMDVTLIREKPKNRKPVKTYSKFESKIKEIINFVKKEIKNQNQVFWVCPLIDKSKKIDHQSAIEKKQFLDKYFVNKVGLIHGSMTKDEKDFVLNNFLKRKIDVLVSTTVIEVGIDFPNANVIIIENANKYGLSQLHQLRGRVGRGNKQAFCILIFKSNLSQNAKKRISILKNTNDGFKISEEDMMLRGYGDILGFKQSGCKRFRLADPILHKNLFDIAEHEVKKIEYKNIDFTNYYKLLKLYDRASIINEIIY